MFKISKQASNTGDGSGGPRETPLRVSKEREQGSALVVLVVLMVTVGGLVTAHLGEVNSEQRKIRTRIYAQRAAKRARGELERARNIVNAASYYQDHNTALRAAVMSDPPFIPGTEVICQQVGGPASEWFLLRASGEFQGITREAQSFCRQRSPVSAFNFFVVSHPLGVSGAPRGAIHSNKKIEFWFPWGTYRDEVTAAEGFEFKGGATAANTRLWGSHNAAAPKTNIMDGTTIAQLKNNATTLKIVDDLIAEVEFKGKKTQVDLFTPAYDIEVERTGTRRVFDKMVTKQEQRSEDVYVDESYKVDVPVYRTNVRFENQRVARYTYVDVPRTVQEPVYKTVREPYQFEIKHYATRQVKKTRNERVWVDDPPPSPADIEGGSSVAGGTGGAWGHYENNVVEYFVDERYVTNVTYETRYRNKQVLDHYNEVTVTDRVRQFSHYENVQQRIEERVVDHMTQETRHRQKFSHTRTWTEDVQVPQYRDEQFTYTETERVPEALDRTEVVNTTGLIYIEKQIRSIKGKVNGRVSIASNDKMKITGSIQYVDNAGNTRMSNGVNPTESYIPNPAFDKSSPSVLGMMARKDILYSKNLPAKVEINAALISAQGKVAMEGIHVRNSDGTVSVPNYVKNHPGRYVKDSIRRLGGIVCDKRPVATFVDDSNKVLAGFKRGQTLMDRNMILKNGGNVTPPYVFQMNKVTWGITTMDKRWGIAP